MSEEDKNFEPDGTVNAYEYNKVDEDGVNGISKRRELEKEINIDETSKIKYSKKALEIREKIKYYREKYGYIDINNNIILKSKMKTEYEFLRDKNIKAIVVPIKLHPSDSTEENTMNIGIELLDTIPFNNIDLAEKCLDELKDENILGIIIKINEDGSFDF